MLQLLICKMDVILVPISQCYYENWDDSYKLLHIVFIKYLWLLPNNMFLLGFVLLRALEHPELLSPSPTRSKTLNLVNVAKFLLLFLAHQDVFLSKRTLNAKINRHLHFKACTIAVMFSCKWVFPLLFLLDPSCI